MPDCSVGNIAGIAGRLGEPGSATPLSEADIMTLANCTQQSEMAASIMQSRGSELTTRLQGDLQSATGPGAGAEGTQRPVFRPAVVDPNAGAQTPVDIGVAASLPDQRANYTGTGTINRWPGDITLPDLGNGAQGDSRWQGPTGPVNLAPGPGLTDPRANYSGTGMVTPPGHPLDIGYGQSDLGQMGGYTNPFAPGGAADLPAVTTSPTGKPSDIGWGGTTPQQTPWNVFFDQNWKQTQDNTQASDYANKMVAALPTTPSGLGSHPVMPWGPAPGRDQTGGGDQTGAGDQTGGKSPVDPITLGYDPNADLGMAPYAAFDPARGTPAPLPDLGAQMDYMGAAPWLKEAGVNPTMLANFNPGAAGQAGADARQMYLDMYAKSAQLPGYFAQQNAGLYGTLPGIYALNNPGAPVLQPAQIASMASELGPTGALGTPGQYLDTNAEWSRLMDPSMETAGGLGQGDLAKLPPDQQLAAVSGAFNSLTPYMTADAASAVGARMQQAQMDWMEASQTGVYPGSFMQWLREQEHADEWL